MNSAAQLTFGLMSGVEKFRPYAAGDVVVSRGERFVIESLTDAYARPALVLISCVDGRQAIKFENEIDYRST
jgi:hypothetical protein